MPEIWDSRPYGFAQAVTFSGPGKRLYLSGQAAMSADGEIQFVDDKAQQMDLCFQNIERILSELGASMADVVQCKILVAQYDAEKDLVALRSVWSQYMQSRVACTLIGVHSLALPGMWVEIEAVAEIPSER